MTAARSRIVTVLLRLRVAAFLLLTCSSILLLLSPVGGEASSDVTPDETTCPESAAAAENDASSCKASDVLLLDGFPPSANRNISLLHDGAAGFPKVSRLRMDEIPPGYFHVAPNGDHEGWFVRMIVPSSQNNNNYYQSCHLAMAMKLVAREIVALYYDSSNSNTNNNDVVARPEVDRRGPHRLVDEEGRPFPGKSTSNRNLHLLLPREAFVHAAVKEGYTRTLTSTTTPNNENNTMTLTTLSLSPRVFLVDNILSINDCEELIRIASQSLTKSKETHYDNDGDVYASWRTSWSGSTPRDARVTQWLWERVKNLTAMPEGGVESPQLLKYEEGTSWYKAHFDFYHHFESRPVEEVRMFVQTRARELMRLNILSHNSDISTLLLPALDDILREPLPAKVAKSLAVQLGLVMAEDAPDTGCRRLLHDFLVQSSNPERDFNRVAVLYASELLQASGVKAASDPHQALAEQYFRLEGVVNDNDTTGVLPYYYLANDYVPYVIKPVQNNRHATVLPILRAADRGGNTAFPQASSNEMGTAPDYDEEFDECKKGLIVKAKAGQALMFYNRSPRGELDYRAEHAGCPPKSGVKYAVNCFTWDSDVNWAHNFLTHVDQLYKD